MLPVPGLRIAIGRLVAALALSLLVELPAYNANRPHYGQDHIGDEPEKEIAHQEQANIFDEYHGPKVRQEAYQGVKEFLKSAGRPVRLVEAI